MNLNDYDLTVYVGAATVGASCWWFMEASNGPKLNYWHLVSKIFQNQTHYILFLFPLISKSSNYHHLANFQAMSEQVQLEHLSGGMFAITTDRCSPGIKWYLMKFIIIRISSDRFI